MYTDLNMRDLGFIIYIKTRNKNLGVPIMAQRKRIWLGAMSLWVWSLTSLSGLRIWRCCELWCRLQMQLRSGIAVAVAYASGYSSDSTPSLGTSICHGCSPKKFKRQKKKERKKERNMNLKNKELRLISFVSVTLGELHLQTKFEQEKKTYQHREIKGWFVCLGIGLGWGLKKISIKMYNHRPVPRYV